MFERQWVIHVKPFTSKFHLYVLLPWHEQCRKFDAHVVYYGAPFKTLSFGITIPFLFTIYMSLGLKINWWHKGLAPNLTAGTYGVWIFIGSHMTSAAMRFGSYRREWLQTYGKKWV